MKKGLSLLLSIVLVFMFSIPVVATVDSEIKDGEMKVAYIDNLNQDGSNVGTDKTNNQSILPTSAYEFSFSLDTSILKVSGNVAGTPFSVSGNIITTNENRNLLLYDTDDSCGNYDVAYMSVERELAETALFFVGFYEQNRQYKNVIKLYMQPKGTNALVLVEIFLNDDFVASCLSSKIVNYDSEKANEIQCWFVNYYHPIDKEPSPKPNSNTDYEELDLSETYYLNGVRVTIHFVVDLYYPTTDLTKNGFGSSSCYFYIAESRTSSDVAANNSSTQGYLRLENLNVQFSNMPYIIFTSQQPYRKNVQSGTGSITRDFSVSFGYSYGLISASGSFSFGKSDSMSADTEAIPLPYTNTYGVKGTESGILPSKLYLNKQGSWYGFKVEYMDTKGTAHSGRMNVLFEYDVVNLYDYTGSYSDTFSDSFYVYVR